MSSYQNIEWMPTSWRHNFFIKLSMKVSKGHIQYFKRTFIYEPSFMKILLMIILWRRNFFMALNMTSSHINVIERFRDFFTFRPSELITTLTYVLMDYFCPCLRLIIIFLFRKLSILQAGSWGFWLRGRELVHQCKGTIHNCIFKTGFWYKTTFWILFKCVVISTRFFLQLKNC